MEVKLIYLIQAIRADTSYTKAYPEIKLTIAYQDLEGALAYKRRIDGLKDKAIQMYDELRSNYLPRPNKKGKTDWMPHDWNQKKLEWKRYKYEIKIVELR